MAKNVTRWACVYAGVSVLTLEHARGLHRPQVYASASSPVIYSGELGSSDG